MRKLSMTLLTIIFFGLNSLIAQHQRGDTTNAGGMMMDNPMMQNMMQSGMMKQMMQNMMLGGMMGNRSEMGEASLVKPQVKFINMLPNLNQRLALTDDQLNKLIDLQASYKKFSIPQKARVASLGNSLQEKCKSNADMSEIENTLNEYVDAKSTLMLKTLEIARSMKMTLNSQQQEKLKTIMSKQMGMMQNMNMMGGMN